MRKTIRLLRRFATACATLLLLQNGAQAQGAVYKCVDDQGRVEFTDTARRGCKALDLPGYAPPPPPRASAPIPGVSVAAVRPSSPGPAAAVNPAAANPAAVNPAGFPRVDSAQQRARDDDRREILNDELRIEQKKLADLSRDFNNGEPERQGNERNYAKYQERVASMRDEIGRTKRNIEALQREISNIR